MGSHPAPHPPTTQNPKDPQEFDFILQKAAGTFRLSKEERAAVYLAYHKDAFNNV